MHDWNDIAVRPDIQSLGAVLQSHFGVWVGIRTNGSTTVPIARRSAQRHQFCQFQMANPRSDSDCRRSIQAWNSRTQCQCHAGLSSIVRPITGTDAVVFASGFLRAAVDDVGAFERDGVSDDAIAALPILDGTGIRTVVNMVEAIRDAIVKVVGVDGVDEPDRCGDLIGGSPAMSALFEQIRTVAQSDATVLIQGENGTGKELVSRAIRELSSRASGPFVAQNCAAIPSELIESELFGHSKGAFSGAHRDRVGLFESADTGTFFLDEIGDMPLNLQTKLLRVLQEGTLSPVGASERRKVDVRMICATHRDLPTMVADKTFREDLYYRINVVQLYVPPLRERGNDIELLARHFLSKSVRKHGLAKKELTNDAVDRIASYQWPGNVRELENEMERAAILNLEKREIDADDLLNDRKDEEQFSPTFLTGNITMPEAVERLERIMITDALNATGWNKSKAAINLGVSRRNLIRKVAAFELEKSRKS